MDTKTFRGELRSNRASRQTFGAFLTHVRRRLDINTQAGLRAYVASRAGGISGPAFVRLLDRVAATGRVGATNLDRIATLFDYRNAATLIDAYLDWKKSRDGEPQSRPRLTLGDSRTQYRFPSGVEFRLNGVTYRILKPIDSETGRGASYAAYRISAEGFGDTKVFLKTVDLRAGRNLREIERVVGDAATRVRQEVDVHRTLGFVPNLARVLDGGTIPADVAGYGELRVPIIVTEWVEGHNLTQSKHGSDERHLRLEATRAAQFVRDLIKTIAGLHSRSIVHGDVHGANVMIDIRNDRIVVVDTGESAFPVPDARRRQSVLTGAANSAGGRAGDHQAAVDFGHDVYGLGQVVWLLLFGGHFPRVDKPEDVRDRVRRALEADDDYYAAVLRQEPGLPAMLTQALHPNADERAQQAGDLLETLDLFRRLSRPHLATRAEDDGLGGRLASLRSQIGEVDAAIRANFVGGLRDIHFQLSNFIWKVEGGPTNPDLLFKSFDALVRRLREVDAERNDLGASIFKRVTHHQLEMLAGRTAQMLEYGRLTVEGRRDTLINVMLDLLATLSHGDTYVTATVPELWSRENLGVAGRLLEANELIALRQVRVRRVIVVDRNRKGDLDQAERVISAQAELVVRLRDRGINTTHREIKAPGVFVGVLDTGAPSPSPLLGARHVALARRGSTTISVSFQLGQNRTIRSLSLWRVTSAPFVAERMTMLQEALDSSTEVTEWVAGGNRAARGHTKAKTTNLRRSR